MNFSSFDFSISVAKGGGKLHFQKWDSTHDILKTCDDFWLKFLDFFILSCKLPKAIKKCRRERWLKEVNSQWQNLLLFLHVIALIKI